MTNVEIANGTLFGGPMTKRLMHCMRSGGTPTKKLTYFWTKGLHNDLIMLRKRGMWTIIGHGDQTPPTDEVEEILTTKLLLQTSKSLQFHMSRTWRRFCTNFSSWQGQDPQSLFEEKESLEEKVAVREYGLHLALEDIFNLKAELLKKTETNLDESKGIIHQHTIQNRRQLDCR
ncbi:hypothetical protein ACS0TY_002929 [Phlomoides rotata]